MKNSDRRGFFRAALSSLYLPHYDALCAALPGCWQPYMGFRSFAQQDALFAQGRRTPGKIVTKAQGGDSPHNYGAATDWAYIDEHDTLIWLPASDPRWHDFRLAVEASGLRWGGEFGDFDHAELKIDCSWKHVHLAYSQNGMRAAMEYIEERLAKA